MGGKTQAMRVQVEEKAHEPRPRWFVVECRHQRERIAKAHLVGQGFKVYLPMRLCPHPKARHAATPFLPGYLFINFDPDVTQWLKILGTEGVHALIMNGQGKPQAVPDKFVKTVEAMELDGVIHLVTPAQKMAGGKAKKGKVAPVFKRGDRVTVTDGDFAGLSGLVHVINDNDRVTLFLALAHQSESVLKIQLQSGAVTGAVCGSRPRGSARTTPKPQRIQRSRKGCAGAVAAMQPPFRFPQGVGPSWAFPPY
jgi:transcriptional antiterminator RfaH